MGHSDDVMIARGERARVTPRVEPAPQAERHRGSLRTGLTGGGSEGNEQLTTVMGAILIVLLAAIGFTIPQLRQFISVHLFIGMLLIGPVLLKLASTGYRFGRYYTGNAEYRRKGPPELILRLIGPVVILSTAGVLATGVVLLFVGPQHRGPWLLLPQSFMNLSGQPVQMLAGFFKIKPEEILVVHDELDFAPGVARLKQGGGIAGHNGLKDISQRLATHDYWRLRLGVGKPPAGMEGADYVLQKPPAEERAAIDAAIERSLAVLPQCLSGDIQSAMQKLHTDDKKQEDKKPEPKKEPEKESGLKSSLKALFGRK